MSDARVMVLEEQVKSLSDELMQCQADKEFVWSLWKRLQVANPDLTQAVSLVVEREKHKAEIKDRKVLEILQSKDYNIQELEQKVTGQQQEINNLVQRRTTVGEESTLMKKELTVLREQLVNKSQELKEMKTECRRKEEEERQVVRALEEEKEGLTSRCAALRADLEEKERQANSQRDQGDAGQARVKKLEEELHNAWQELSAMQSHSSSLAAQLSAKEREMAAKEAQLSQLRRECAEVQTLYRQSTEHAAEQNHLIKQLEGLNLDTQKVLRNQEEAHTADTTSYQRLYKELSQCYQALTSSEANLRQSHQELNSLLAQKDQHILQLQAQLQQQQEQIQLQQQQQAQHTALYPSPNRQTNFKAVVSEQIDAAAQRSSPDSDWASTRDSDPRPEDKTRQCRSTSSVRRQQVAPVQRSRSLSPASSVELGSGRGRGRGAEKRIQDLEELLKLKMEENEELRRAHDKRRERLCLIQTNYKTVRDQLKEMEKSNGLPGGRMQRAEPWQLRQENSDAVWNELAYLKNLTRKLSTEKAGLEEELDMLRVQAAMDRATVKELHLCLANEHQELLHKVVEERQVKSSTPKKLSVSSERMEQSFKKIEQLERKMLSLEEETEKLREEKEQLLEAKEDLARNCCRLKASLDHLRTQEAVREEAAQAQALAQEERHRSEIVALEARISASHKEITKLHQQLLKLRQELGILRAARDFYKNRALGPARAGGITSNISSKVKFKTTRLRGPLRQRSHRTVSPNQAISWQGRSPSPTKDEWEDMSIDSDSGEEYSDSLNGVPSRTTTYRRRANRKSYMCSLISDTDAPVAESSRKQADVLAQDDEQHELWERGTRGEKRRWRRKRMLMKTQHCSSSSLQQRIESLQRHIDILRSARKDAVLSARELRRANEKITAQLNSLTEKLCSSKQLTQKLTSDLAGTEQQKKVLEMELEQWRQITFPQQTAPPPPAAPTPPVNTECSCLCRTMPTPAGPAPQALEAEVKQLQTRIKSASAEVTRQVAANKALRGQLQEKEDKLRQLQDKTSHTERDVNMKRQLVEDLKTRLKFLQEMEKSYHGQVEELEKKVKTLSEEANNRKALIESLKRRLNVATTEKSQYEALSSKLKEDLEKKEQRIHALQARVGAGEQALAALQQTATEQMEGLTQQSTHALDRLQRQLGQAYSQLEELHSFIKALASEILLDVQEVKQQLMKRRRLRQANAVAAKGGLSAKSMIKAKSIAASILNMSENDLADIMDTDQGTEARSESPRDQEWLDDLNHILQQKKVSEKVGGAEGTKLDEDFTEMEKKMDTTARAVLDIMTKTTEYLQPNPATRAKMSMMNSMSRMRGQEKGPGYTQTEAILGESMQRFGRELGEESNFGLALIDAGEAMRELGEVKDALDMEVKQNFIDPLQNLHEKDLKEIQHHLKKMEGRRLDFDYKKKRQGKVTEDEIKQALEKFDDSKEIAEQSMFNLLESDIEQVSQLAALVHAQVEYHSRAAEILTQLSSKIDERIRDTSVKPRKEFTPKPRTSLDFSISENHNGGIHSARSPAPMDQPCCRALYDFDPENEGELGFKEGDIITLTNKIDDNWYEGMLHGNSGFFPINYVDILVPLPH